MYEKLFHVASQIIGVSTKELNENSSQKTVAFWDSLKHMNLILALEEEFDITFSDEEITKIGSMKDIIVLLKSKGIPEVSL